MNARAPFSSAAASPRGRVLFIAVVAMLIGAVSLSAQPNAVEDLKRELDAAPPERRAVILTDLAHQLEAIDVRQSYEYARQAVAAATNETAELRAIVELVSLERRMGEYAVAMKAARDGLARAEALSDRELQASFLYLVGRLHWNLSDYPASIEAHLTELRLGTALDDAAIQSKAHTGLGLTYGSYGQMERAREHLLEGLRFARAARDPEQLAISLNSLGNLGLDTGDYGLAREYHTQALALREELGSTRGVADSLTNLGLIEEANGSLELALDYYQRALGTYERLGLKRYLANAHRRLGAALGNLGRTEEGLSHLHAGLRLAETLGSQEVLTNLYRDLATLHEKRGELGDALNYERARSAARDAARGEQDRQRVAELSARYEAERSQHEIERLRQDQALKGAELRRQRFQGIALAATLGLGLAISGAAFVIQRTRLRAERRLRAATDDACRRAEAAERLKSRLLMIAAHDLKAPLAALTATAERIGRSVPASGEVGRLAAGMRADTSRMGSLMRDFLDAEAIEQGRLQLHRATLDLGVLVASAAEGLRPLAERKSQTLTLGTLPEGLPEVQADADRLRQVMDNLLTNALKFTPARGTITVKVGEMTGWVYAEVADTGPGLKQKDFGRIFGAYQPLSATPTDGENTTGLGLFITQELLALHGGRLTVESQPGQGAVFRVLLPVPASAETVAETPADESGQVMQA